MKTFHVDEPREIGKKKQRISPKDKMMIKKDMSEKLNITSCLPLLSPIWSWDGIMRSGKSKKTCQGDEAWPTDNW